MINRTAKCFNWNLTLIILIISEINEMSKAKINLIFTILEWLVFVIGCGFLGYSIYAMVVGRVVVSSRAYGEKTILLSTGWPFTICVMIYLVGALTCFWLVREAQKKPPK